MGRSLRHDLSHRSGIQAVMLMMVQLLPNATDIRTVFPTLVYQALEK